MAQQRPQIPADMIEFNRMLIEDVRAHGGKATVGPFAGREPMILTTKGRKSREPRSVVIGHTPHGEGIVVIASNNGAPGDPHWYRNLLADPHATVELGAKKYGVVARTTEGEERDRMGALVEYFGRQQALTDRQIPVVVLERIP